MALQLDSGTIQLAQRRLDVLGNNISNVNTVGFKGASFDALLGNAMASGGGAVQNFAQGNISTSTNPLDLAINGNGLFKLQTTSGQSVYSRDGQFSLNKAGEVVNSSGDKLLGADNNPITINVSETSSQIVTTDIKFDTLALDSRKPALSTTADTFNSVDPSTYTNSTMTSVYDDSGTLRNVQTFYVKTASTTWDVYYAVDGNTVKQPINDNNSRLPTDSGWVPTYGAPQKSTLTFNSAGNLTSIVPSVSVPFHYNNGVPDANSPTVKVNLNGAKQLGSSFSAVAIQYNDNGTDKATENVGRPIGQMTGYSVGGDGVITAKYSNGATAIKGHINLSTFKNMQGLAAIGNNKWQETAASGPEVSNMPGASGVGSLQGLSTEDSNVDLTVEMIKLISAQRAFQAASEVVKKQDEILQGVVHIGQ